MGAEHTFYQAAEVGPWNLVSASEVVASVRMNALNWLSLFYASGREAPLQALQFQAAGSDPLGTRSRWVPSFLPSGNPPVSQCESSLPQDLVFPAWNMDMSEELRSWRWRGLSALSAASKGQV